MNRLRRIVVDLSIFVALLCAPSPLWAQQIDRAHAAATLGQLPIRFEPTEQKGAFLARGIGAAVRVSGTSIDFPLATNGGAHGSIRVRFAGARRSSRVIGVDLLPGRVNYLYGNDPSRWRRNVPTYARARTSSLYRGIDVDYYSAGDQLEYDLIVQPNADPESIRLAVSGALVRISEAGDLVYGDATRVFLRRPIAYQVLATKRRDITVEYRRRPDGTIGFALGAYDHSQALVIDPIVAYSFAFGGSGDEQVYDIAVDDIGAVYVGGETYSNNFPTVNAAQLRQDAGNRCNFYGIGTSICRDAFLAKLAANGTSLEYATYFVSTSFDSINHIAVDSSHALYFAGWTTTETTSSEPDIRNSFIGKLAANGSQVLYTYFSPRCCAFPIGPQLVINDLAIGADGSAYVATSGPNNSEVAVLSPTGTNYHAIYTLTDPSGFRRTTFTSIAVRGNSLFVGGDTTWSAFPTTTGAAQTQFGGIRDALIMKMALDGTLVYSTFAGGAGSETIADVAVDQNGAVYGAGDRSADDSVCSPLHPGHEVLVTKIAADGASIVYTTYLPYWGGCSLPPIRIAIDTAGNAYTVGCGSGDGFSQGCRLWKVGPTGTLLRTLPDVPWKLFAIDATGTAKWFAPIGPNISIVKLVPQFALTSFGANTPLPARFATPITWTAGVTADEDVEISFWRYDTPTGWSQVQAFGPSASYSWTPAVWDAGSHYLCTIARIVGAPGISADWCLPFTITGSSPGEPPVLAPAADFTLDHRPDLMWQNITTGELAWWNMGGGGHGEQLIAGGYLNAPRLPAGWRVAGAGDIDGNGSTDLVIQSDTGQLAVCLFDGPVFRAGMFINPGQVPPEWKIRAVADMNHDGHPDLIWQHAPTGQLSIWLLNGANLLQPVFPSVAAPGGEWEIVGVGDSNRDGERDLFWQHRTQGTLAVWRMRGTELAGGLLMSMSPADAHWRVAAIADLDGDGYSDLVFQHADSGLLAAWYFADVTMRFGVMLDPSIVTESAWKLTGPR